MKQNTATCFLYGLSCIKMRSLRLAMLIKEIFPFSDQKILEIIREIFGLSKIYLEISRHYVLRLNIYNLYYISSYVLSYIINNNQNSNIAFKILTAQSLQLLHALIAKHFGLAVLCHNTKKKNILIERFILTLFQKWFFRGNQNQQTSSRNQYRGINANYWIML